MHCALFSAAGCLKKSVILVLVQGSNIIITGSIGSRESEVRCCCTFYFVAACFTSPPPHHQRHTVVQLCGCTGMLALRREFSKIASSFAVNSSSKDVDNKELEVLLLE